MNTQTPINGASERVTSGPYSLGLDIGIASVGWALLGQEHIIDLGVRAFEKGETAKDGDPLNLQRRTARLMRRRLHRRAWRLKQLARLLKRHGLIDSPKHFLRQPGYTDSTWHLRVQGLDRLLTAEEWARVLYHLCKHRGFHWSNRAEEHKAATDNKSEGGRVKAGLASTQQRMQTKGYRTAAEMVLAEFPEAQRNKQGQYDKALSRVLLGNELALLFQAQRNCGNLHASEALETALRGTDTQRGGLFWQQKPALAGKDLLKMLGHCTFEKQEYRAPKASFTAEMHVWLTRLNNLRVVVNGESRALTEPERQAVLWLPHQSAEKFTYKHLKRELIRLGHWPDSARFGGLSYPSTERPEATKAKDPEDQILLKLPGWHELKRTFKAHQITAEWDALSTSAIQGEPNALDDIAWILSVYKDDAEVETELRKLKLPDAVVQALLTLRFDKFSNLSLKALRRIVPLMQTGLRYDEAVAQVPEYGHHSQPAKANQRQLPYLPSFYLPQRKYQHKTDRVGSMVFNPDLDVPRNPVVLRALNQARKVVNAIVRKYGAPSAVHIEMARDLSRPLDERRDVEKLQQEYRDRNRQERERFEEEFHRKPKSQEFEKWMLYREQQGKCAYSLVGLDLDRVINDPNYVQIDHALPYSRSYDDSKNNKVLALTRENQNKGNRTPYEYLDGASHSEQWQRFVAWVETNKAYRQAKRSRLLRKNFDDKEAESFKERNLNDTRYICRFFKSHVEEHLQLATDSPNKRCVVVNGQLTAFLRAKWGLIKLREESDRHHALDAAVVAACSHGMVKALADHSRRKELAYLREGIPDPQTGEITTPSAHRQLANNFPEPWPHFRHELEHRLKTDDAATLREEMARLGTYSPGALNALRPLFVSRAPQRRTLGAVHKDTIYGQPEYLKQNGTVSQKVPLTSLSLKDLDKLIDPHRNVKLYAAIRQRLEAHGGKGEKAFAADNPLHKPDKHGNPTGPLVKAVTLTDKLTGIPIRGGVAKNESMLRVDVFTKVGKFHLVPVYVHHRVSGLPNRAIVAFKDEAEWTLMDDSFEFLFSLHPNDLVRVTLKDSCQTGYFSGCDRSTGAISLWAHDRHKDIGKDGLIRGIGVKTAISLEKFNVDVLGHIYPARAEQRHGLA
jgi:CRISPR-associated endonuclease Csn1